MKSKALVTAICLALTATAYAQTESLQLPVKHFSPICGNAPVNEQTITGFSPDGSFVLVQAHGYTACGSHGVSYVYWCQSLAFDLSGAFISETDILPPTYQGYNNCPWADDSLSFTNPGGYLAFTTSNWNHSQTVPELQLP
jgi:hypothetical protein